MLVEAINKGFYGGNRIKPGMKFHILKEEHFSEKWMKRVGEKEPVLKVEKKEPKKEKKEEPKKNKRASDEVVL